MNARIGADLTGYYRLHAPIYDLSRPLFLFGRERLVRLIAAHAAAGGNGAPRILEIGCGTGRNLRRLQRLLPHAELVGLDLSEHMLAQAQKRLHGSTRLLHGALGSAALAGPFDVVFASYMLSMTGAAQDTCIAAARAELAPGGLLAVVDFLSTPSPTFARWMDRNHVHFRADLPRRLGVDSDTLQHSERAAWGGAWRYFVSVQRCFGPRRTATGAASSC